jgi:hypothetical protein
MLHMGGFHTLMNVLGAIGKLMEGSGLQNVLQIVYGENAVQHMLGGKAVQRALRGHFLMDRALNRLLLSTSTDEDDGKKILEMISKVEDLFADGREGRGISILCRCRIHG